MITAADFAKRLLARRRDLGVTQDAVGRRVPVSGNTVGKWERAARLPTPQLARAWAGALGVPIAAGLAEALFPPAPPARAECGTPRGYKQHLRRGEVCRQCRKAWSNYVMALRKLRSERAGSGQ